MYNALAYSVRTTYEHNKYTTKSLLSVRCQRRANKNDLAKNTGKITGIYLVDDKYTRIFI